MTVTVVALRERASNERRVALSPEVAKKLKALGAQVVIEAGAGSGANQPDGIFPDVEVEATAAAALARADVLLAVQPPSLDTIAGLREGSIVIGFMQPHADPERVKALRDRKITSFAMELLPRTTRAQAMDVLSSQAGMAGYKAVLIAAELSGKFFPMLTTAAGTIRPSKVLIVGAGVAGLQAIATARRLGAQVEGFDVRPETREQIESLGAKFLDLGVSAAGSGGYARELTDEEKAKQAEILAKHVAAADAVITTAAIPGRPSPRIIPAAVVEQMKPGAVIIDLAAEGGGNCELTKPGEHIEHNGVIIYGPLNVPSMLPVHASEMYAKNLLNFLSPMIKDGELKLDWDDEVIRDSALTHAGEIRHAPTRALVEGASS